MRTINFSKARKNLRHVLDQVNEDADCTIITRREAPEAVVMSMDHYNALMETVHLLRSPANAAHLARSLEQHRRGKLKEHPLDDAE